jgi:hypothetical protein
MTMLSPHELATLMLVHRSPEQIDTTRVELDTLLHCRLIAVERVSGRPVLTAAGQHWLEAAARIGPFGTAARHAEKSARR